MSPFEDVLFRVTRAVSRSTVPAMGVVAGIAAIATVFSTGRLDFAYKDIIVFVGVGTAFLVVLMTQYLSASRFRADPEDTADRRMLVREVMELRKQQSLLAPESRKELVSELRASIGADAARQLIQDVRAQVLQNDLTGQVADRAKTTLSRIYAEIDALGRRGNINLVLGVVTAIAGVAALSMFVVFDSREHATLESFAIAFLPRLSIVVIIEVFSYFFLRLYKSSLSEIKYFQNEATNIEYNFVALETALHRKDDDLIRRSLARFIEIERNPLMEKTQTTRELQSEEVTAQTLKISPEYLLEVMKVLASKKPSDAKPDA